jgi:hypothetical protein
MNQKIEVNVKPLSAMRYKTLGDFFYDKDGTLVIETADIGNPLFNKLILIHEFIEQTLTEELEIDEPDIKAFDEAHPDADDPGMLPDAIYADQHLLADAVERLMLSHLGIPYKNYEDACKKTWDGK